MIDIKPIPGQGLEISMHGCIRLRLQHGGAEFWIDSYQSLLRETFAPLLPRMEFIPERNVVRVSLHINGEEVMGTSRPMSAAQLHLTAAQDELLRGKIRHFSTSLSRSDINPDFRIVGESFVLPDPLIHPELYRIYGSPHDPQLAIIWGMEKVPDSSLAPATAAGRFKVDKVLAVMYSILGYFRYMSPTMRKVWGAGAGAILLLLLCLVMVASCSDDEEGGSGEQPLRDPLAQLEMRVEGSKMIKGKNYNKIVFAGSLNLTDIEYLKIDGQAIKFEHGYFMLPPKSSVIVEMKLKGANQVYKSICTFK